MSSRIIVGVPLDTAQRVYDVRLINAPITEVTNPAVQNAAVYLREYLCSEDTLISQSNWIPSPADTPMVTQCIAHMQCELVLEN
jgi:hypothetical protein